MKKIFAIFLFLLISLPSFGAGTIVTYTIDPEKNAYEHNNKGVMHMEEKCYYAAIQEFKIAISLNPKTQATAVYFNNLGKVYMIIGYPELARDCFENAITQYSLNFEYWQNLANCYKKLGKTDEKLAEYRLKQKDNPIAKVMVGLLEEQNGNTRKAITDLDEFSHSEPDLLITPAVKNHIKKLVAEVNKM